MATSAPYSQENQFTTALPSEERTDEHFVERHNLFLKLVHETPIQLLFLGDSITRRWVDYPELWNEYFSQYQPANFGIGGDLVQSLLWRIQNGELDHIQPEVIVLSIGTNNIPTHSVSEIADTIRLIVATIQEKLPESKILLMAIFPRGPQVRSKSDDNNPYYMNVVNAVNKHITSLGKQDSIHFLDIGSLFLGKDGEIDTSLLPDQLHLIGPGYEIWGRALEVVLEKMVS